EGHKDSSQKVISLLNYGPSFVYDIPQIQKASALKNKKDKRSSNSTWLSSALLSNSGTHELTFYHDTNRLNFKSAQSKEQINGERITKVITPVIEGQKGSLSFSIKVDCELELRFYNF